MDSPTQGSLTGTRSLEARARSLATHAVSGVLVFALQLIQAASFAALVFQGNLAAGFGQCLWAALVGIAVVGMVVAWRSSVQPLSTSVDTPSLAVSAILATSIASRVADEGFGSGEAAVIVLLALTLSTAVSGLGMLLLGSLHLGKTLRFVPFSVVAGFLGATGWLVMAGGLQVMNGKSASLTEIFAAPSPQDLIRIAVAIGFALTLRLGAKVVKSGFFMPGLLVLSTVAIDVVLRRSGGTAGWYLEGTSAVAPWLPLRAVALDGSQIWPLLVASLPDIFALSIVTLISVVVKYATLELNRSRPVDLDRELVAHGLGNLLVAPAGGLFMCLNLSTNQLLRVTGARGYGFSIVAALAIVGFLATGIDLARVVPAPLLAGLLIFLGSNLLFDAVRAPLAQRAWFELATTLVILLVCVLQGYIVGVLTGLAASCLIFVASYARISVVRRHVSGESLIGRAARPQETIELLRQEAGGVHTFWLSGYLFFGSSEQVFDRVRAVVEPPQSVPARYVILDFADVPGTDASARASISRLKAFCAQEGAVLIFSGLSPPMRESFARANIIGPGEASRTFADYGRALAWCEAEIIKGDAAAGEGHSDDRFLAWLAREVGGERAAAELVKSLIRVEYPPGSVIYKAGDASNSIGFVASGSVEVRLPGLGTETGVDRHVMGSTVIGEMGFFRRKPRGATVMAETASVIYVLERESMRDLERRQPYLAAALCRFIIRELAERLETANTEVTVRR